MVDGTVESFAKSKKWSRAIKAANLVAVGIFFYLAYVAYQRHERNLVESRTRNAFAELEGSKDDWQATHFVWALKSQQESEFPASDFDRHKYQSFCHKQLERADDALLVVECFKALAVLGDDTCCELMQRAVVRMDERLRTCSLSSSEGPNGTGLEICMSIMKSMGCGEVETAGVE